MTSNGNFKIFIFTNIVHVLYSITCKNNLNQDVDWYVIYKIPKLEENTKPVLQQGYGFVYLDNANQNWNYTGKSIKENDNALGYTMKQLYDNKYAKSFMFLSYNDKSPNNKEHFDRGHTKGVLMANRTIGAWLVHSLPKFPAPITNQNIPPFEDDDISDNSIMQDQMEKDFDINEDNTDEGFGTYIYPSNGAWNGQIFMCITVDYAQLLNISQLIYYNTPFIHDMNVPEDFKIGNPFLALLSENKDIRVNKSIPWFIINQFESMWTKTAFTGFAKYRKFDSDIYTDIITPYYNTPILVETWQTDRIHRLNSSCKPKERAVENIKAIAFLPTSPIPSNLLGVNKISDLPIPIRFSELIDHSKWAVTNAHYPTNEWTNSFLQSKEPAPLHDPQVVCIGDLNREATQAERSGGLVCFSQENVWNAFRAIVADIEPCPIPPPPVDMIFNLEPYPRNAIEAKDTNNEYDNSTENHINIFSSHTNSSYNNATYKVLDMNSVSKNI